MNVLLSLVFFFSLFGSHTDIPLHITIDELRSTKGNIGISVFLDQESFAADKAYMHKDFTKKGHTIGDSFTCSIVLPEGVYGIAILDDENEDTKMNYNWFGVPKEGYGFSHFNHTGFKKPVYSDFEFELNEESKEMNITLRYF